jgi:hypothetical protein
VFGRPQSAQLLPGGCIIALDKNPPLMYEFNSAVFPVQTKKIIPDVGFGGLFRT